MAQRPPIVLFLQGPPSPLWTELADSLAAAGAEVRRVHFCAADRVFWGLRPCVSYRGRLSGWRRWIRDFMRREGVTDVLYYADRHPYHRLALKAARGLGVSAHAIENGYLRPDWITLEREGGGGYSHFPDAPEALDPAAPAFDAKLRYPHGFPVEAAYDVAFNLIDVLGRPFYPFYHSDRYYAPIPDYLRWLVKLARSGRAARASARTQSALLEDPAPFWLMAMQLQSDYQLRASAAWPHQRDAIRAVLRSFADHAPAHHRLAFKLHPLESGVERFPAVIAREAEAAGLARRVAILDGGDLGRLVKGAEGVIAINSTVGVHALRAGRPVKPLGAAVYAMPGLTHQGPLDRFWTEAAPPDPDRLSAFLRTLARDIQVKGSFYNPAGRAAAVAEITRRLVAGRIGPSTWRPCAAPPRLSALIAQRRRARAGLDPLPLNPASGLSAEARGAEIAEAETETGG